MATNNENADIDQVDVHENLEEDDVSGADQLPHSSVVRKRKLTPQGLAYSIEKNTKNLDAVWKRTLTAIQAAENEKDETVARKLIDETNTRLTEYKEAWRTLVNLHAQDDIGEHTSSYEVQNKIYQYNMSSVNDKIDRLKRSLRRLDEEVSVVSRRSNRSSGSSIRSQQAKARADAAAAVEKLRYTEEISRKMREMARIKAQQEEEQAANKAEIELLKVRQEVAEMQARASVLSEIEEEIDVQPIDLTDPMGTSNDHARRFLEDCPVSDRVKGNRNDDKIVQMPVTEGQHTREVDEITNHLLKKELLTTSLQEFDGRPTNFRAWKAAFKGVTKTLKLQSTQELNLIIKWVGKEAAEFVKPIRSVSIENPEKGLQLTWEVLERRYGAPEIIENELMQKLKDSPQLIMKDREGLLNLSFLLMELKFAKEEGKYPGLQSLDSAYGLNPLVMKLPHQLRERWLHKGTQYKKDRGVTFPPFNLFVEFIDNEARKRNDPSFIMESSADAQHQTSRYKSSKVNEQHKFSRPKSTRTFFTKAETSLCVVCNEHHFVESCQVFKGMKINERELVVKEKGLCRGCLHRGHIWRNCRQRKTCEICKKQHPSILHQFTVSSGNQQSLVPESIKSTSRSSKSTAETSCVSSIIPVWVEHDTKRVLTYALLDEQSDACFVSDEVKQKLGVKGPTLELEISTVLTTGKVKSERIEGLKVRGLNQEDVVNLPTAYSREYIPGSAEQIPTPDKLRNWPHLSQLQDQLSPLISMAVGLLIGANCPKVLTPRDVIPGIRDGDPYGIRTVLGWSVVGVINSQEGGKTTSLKSCRTSTKELIAVLERDFIELDPPQDSALSIEEKKFLSYMEKGLEISNGHIQLPLPFKVKEPKMPNNRWVAERRLSQLRVKLQKDPELAEGYTAFMEKIIEENQAEMVPMNEILNDAWYLPHHNVKHPHKPDKVRVVLDGAAKCDGISLNDVLLKGPNMTNSLVGVLMRFREEPVAIVGDIEGMFYQVKVKPDHRDYLRFLWWEKGQLNQEPQVYRMTVHVFGAVSSPGCANYALKETARRFSKENDDVVKFVENGFYVDDGLISVSSTKKAIALIESTITTLKKGGFKLHKFLSNRPEVIAALPPDLVSTKIDALTDLSILPTERTLGILWNASTDQFEFKAHLDERPATRRGILATVSSIFDPLGFVGPYVLNGKRILQKTCVNGAAWDDQVDQTTQEEWSEWKRQLAFLDKLKIERCYKPTSDEQTEIVAAEIHHFSDASEQGYGQCSYLRLVDSDKRVQVSLLSSKCRVTPTKAVTMPRLELVAATLSSKMAAVIRRELKSKYDDIISEHFWSDSRVVLGYIKNESRRFHTFVANRVETIRSFSEPEQWHYIRSGENPADIASRGKTAEELINSQLWWRGPPYLSQLTYTIENSSPEIITDDDVEVKRVKTCTTHIPVQLIPNMLKRYSSWSKSKRVLALCLIFIYKCRGWKRRGELMVSDIERAERIMIEVVQHNDGKLMEGLKSLNPMLDENGIIRVGGRLRNSSLAQELKHPIVLPRNSEVTRLVITHYHERTHHQGRGITLNTIRNAGFWIIGGTTTVGKFIRNCVNCRKLRRLPESQKMADLPADRLEPTPAFTNCGVDLFGPFIVKNGRKEEKRYGVLFTCLVSRAVHIEVANSLSTDSFINALRRMIARRGAVKVMRSDNGTNFIGASRELKEAINEMDISNIQSKLLDFNCQWIWNVPTASHHGGVWERMIRTTRSILNGLMMEHRAQLNDEMLCTFMTEAEGIVNSRPLYTTNDISLEPLTPALLLTMRICIPPPPGNFNRHGKYSRKLWRRVQHLADTFWSRWRKEYIHTLQERQKWTGKTRNMKRDDIVLVMNNNLPRNQWELARVTEVMASQDNMVRKVKLFCGRGKIELERPVTKLVLLVPAEEEHKNEC